MHKATVEKFKDDWTKPGNIVSNGAYQLTEWTPQASLTYVKNPELLGRRQREGRQGRDVPDRGSGGRAEALQGRRA